MYLLISVDLKQKISSLSHIVISPLCVRVCVCVSSALASRCLQLVVHYIPVIRAHFETRLQPKQYSVLRHFDHITKVDTRSSHIHQPHALV